MCPSPERFELSRRNIMNATKTVQNLMDAIQNAEWDKAKSFLTADFEFSGPVPQPISADAWIGMSKSLKTAFPNLEYNFRTLSEESDTVKISAQLNGTHSADLDLTAMQWGVIPATQKPFAAALEHGEVTVKGDQVARWANEPTPGAGLIAILELLDIKVPTV
jgi:predicted ester cyclase